MVAISPRRTVRASVLAIALAAGTLGAWTGANSGAASRPADPRTDCAAVLASPDRQAAFRAAARAAQVPATVLLAVSYLESRWDHHGGAHSTAGGYGPMHLTNVAPDNVDGRGDGVRRLPDRTFTTAHAAAARTGLSVRQLTHDAAANICGGAALLADHQRGLGHPVGVGSAPGDWYAAVARYSTAVDRPSAARFARQAYQILRTGAERTTVDGEWVRLAAHPAVRPARAQMADAGFTSPGGSDRRNDPQTDCPTGLGCEWIGAPYEKFGAEYYEYGNHDLADRPNTMSIDYIVVHDTETSYEGTLELVQDPTYVSWQYTLRSSDGHIAQHVGLHDVAWHAGNWYMNMHSIGLEHEGFAAQGAKWFTESMYRTSAKLVRHLTAKYDIPRDRGHIIGHDQIPGIAPEYVAGMHWDPGPYWDWEHYMDLVGAPIRAAKTPGTGQVTVRPGFDDNRQLVTGCKRAGKPCREQGSNFVYVHKRPRLSAPLISDEALNDGGPGTREVSDIGPRAPAGHELVIADRKGAWRAVWWQGKRGWIRTPADDQTLVRSRGVSVVPKPGRTEVPVYGRAYPEEAAYEGTEIPYQVVTPLQYTIKAGQSYVVADADPQTNYYYAKSYADTIPDDHTVVNGSDRYYQIWFGHRFAYVRAADVRLLGD